MSSRELQKAARRQTILDAARMLIREGKDSDFSMPALAAAAGVSLVTPYNLFGSKSNILVEIVREDIYDRIAEIGDLPSANLVEWTGELAARLAKIYYRNRHFYRRMIVALVAQESAEGQRESSALAYDLFTEPLKRLRAQGKITTAVPAELIARYVAHSVSGSLQHRLMERGSEALLQWEIELGLTLLMSGICVDAERAGLAARMATLGTHAQ